MFDCVADHKRYIEKERELREEKFIEDAKAFARKSFNNAIPFKSTLIVLYVLVWIWGVSGRVKAYLVVK